MYNTLQLLNSMIWNHEISNLPEMWFFLIGLLLSVARTLIGTDNHCWCLISPLPLAFDWQIHLFTVSENFLLILTQPIFKIKSFYSCLLYPYFPFYIITDYDRLRIGGLILAGLLVMGGLVVILCKMLNHFNKYTNTESWEKHYKQIRCEKCNLRHESDKNMILFSQITSVLSGASTLFLFFF